MFRLSGRRGDAHSQPLTPAGGRAAPGTRVRLPSDYTNFFFFFLNRLMHVVGPENVTLK